MIKLSAAVMVGLLLTGCSGMQLVKSNKADPAKLAAIEARDNAANCMSREWVIMYWEHDPIGVRHATIGTDQYEFLQMTQRVSYTLKNGCVTQVYK